MAKITSVSPLAPEAFPELPVIAGARWSTIEAGIRYRDRTDLLLLELAQGSTVGGVLTRSLTAGHPVTWCRKALAGGKARGLIVNSGNANVFRGAEGDAAVRTEAEAVAAALDCEPLEVFVASTGVIGERLPVEKITGRVGDLVSGLVADGIGAGARAIMTTDTFAKGATATAVIDGTAVTIAGIAKGSGMIAPDMATMLAFVVTDAALPASIVQALIASGADRSFNCITVDSDTSTSDTLLLFATGKAGNRPVESLEDPGLEGFRRALDSVLLDLALQVIKDGEGAQKLIAITVDGAATADAARRIGLIVANSPLVKTAIAGGDANWGRVVMAIGKSQDEVDLSQVEIAFGGIAVARSGGAVPDLDETAVTAHLAGRDIDLRIKVGAGPGSATVWTCDLTHGYIDINADYRS